jgi:heterodisulfide reductase subunit C
MSTLIYCDTCGNACPSKREREYSKRDIENCWGNNITQIAIKVNTQNHDLCDVCLGILISGGTPSIKPPAEVG